MKPSPPFSVSALIERFRQPDGVLTLVLAALAALALVTSLQLTQQPVPAWTVVLFFVVYGVFTITMGFPNPVDGHVSFDRVAQVASILVLGPVHAAWVNAIASLLFPLGRLRKGTPGIDVLNASLCNAGIMTLVILAGGGVYAALGGPMPLVALDLRTLTALAAMGLTMQFVNDALMMFVIFLRRGDYKSFLNAFSVAVELGSVGIAVLVALVYNRMEMSVLVLLLVVLSTGMYVLKKFTDMRRHLQRLVEERTRALHEKSLELERQATHDKLTGLFNRRYADDFMDRELGAADRHAHRFSVAFVDVDFFKSINDDYSHSIGDKVLVRIAELLSERCRRTDMIARYGGEEFLICFPETGVSTAEYICEELRRTIEAETWNRIAIGIEVTASFGVTDNSEYRDRATLLAAADERLYRAKKSGRNRVVA